jgi:hypothetical protein
MSRKFWLEVTRSSRYPKFKACPFDRLRPGSERRRIQNPIDGAYRLSRSLSVWRWRTRSSEAEVSGLAFLSQGIDRSN